MTGMATRQMWAAVVLVGMTLTSVTVMLTLHVAATAVTSVISVLVIPALAAVLYSKVETIQKQTNGNQSALLDMVSQTLDHLKTHSSVPNPEQPLVPAGPIDVTQEIPKVKV